MIHYKEGQHIYSLSLSDLQDKYIWFCQLSDDDFMENINKAIHFAVYLIGIRSEVDAWHYCLDEGVLHQLVHLSLNIEPQLLPDIRKQFEKQLKVIP